MSKPSDDSRPSNTSEDEDCRVCLGTGEITVTIAPSYHREQVGCPLCIAQEKDAEITRLREVLGALHNLTVPNINNQLETLRVDISGRPRALAVEGLKNGG